MPITLNKQDPYNFYLDTKVFLPHGLNRWVFHSQKDTQNKLTPNEFIQKMADSGINTLRMTIPGELQRGIEPELGKYDENFLTETDEVFDLAEKHNIHIVLCLFDYSSFYAPWSPEAWNYGIYSTKFASPKELFTNLELRDYMKQRAQFLIKHFSKFSNIFAWEVMNEMNKIGELYGDESEGITMAWFTDMSQFIKQVDSQHLVTGSLWGDAVWESLNTSDQNDFIQIHTYKEEVNPVQIALIIKNYCLENKKYNKPVVVSEFASKKDNPKRAEFVKQGLLAAQHKGCSAWLYASVWDSDAKFGMGHGDMTDELFEVYKETTPKSFIPPPVRVTQNKGSGGK